MKRLETEDYLAWFVDQVRNYPILIELFNYNEQGDFNGSTLKQNALVSVHLTNIEQKKTYVEIDISFYVHTSKVTLFASNKHSPDYLFNTLKEKCKNEMWRTMREEQSIETIQILNNHGMTRRIIP